MSFFLIFFYDSSDFFLTMWAKGDLLSENLAIWEPLPRVDAQSPLRPWHEISVTQKMNNNTNKTKFTP